MPAPHPRAPMPRLAAAALLLAAGLWLSGCSRHAAPVDDDAGATDAAVDAALLADAAQDASMVADAGPRDAAPPDAALPDAAALDAALPEDGATDGAVADGSSPDAWVPWTAPDFTLQDINPDSATFGQQRSVVGAQGKVLVLYFVSFG